MPESQDPRQVTNNDLRNAQFGGGFINAENVNAQRIGGDIWNIFLGQQTTPVGNPARPKNERILLAAVKEEVTARLRQSLHNAVLINLGKESQPQQVRCPWDAEIKIGLKPPESFVETTSILEVFDNSAIAGKLLILGAPGSGKTTTMLELAQTLIARAEDDPNYPIPVLFNLSSWKNAQQSISEWLVVELKSKYGVWVNLGKEWIKNYQLLPLLDGLDELESRWQETCVQAINQLLHSEYRPQYLVICCRQQEYSNYKTKLQLSGAICLWDLDDKQVQNYLLQINRDDLWEVLQNDETLSSLCKKPFWLNILVLSEQELPLDKQRLTFREKGWQSLLSAYIQQMLNCQLESRAYNKLHVPSKRQTQYWLAFLASQLAKESKTEFAIEEIQLTWLLTTKSKRLAAPIAGLLTGLLVGLNWWLTSSLSFLQYWRTILNISSIFWLSLVIIIFWITLSILIYLLVGLEETIQPIEILQWSWKKLIKKLIRVAKIALIFLLLLLSFLLFNPNLLLILLPIVGIWLYVWLTEGLSVALIEALDGREIESKVIPNQGIWKSAINYGTSWLRYGVISALIGVLIGVLIDAPVNGLIAGLFFGLDTGHRAGLNCGGKACIQHLALRITLWQSSYIPWNYARFLDYCTERMLLQRVGGRYRFIHKLLQDHFAQMELRRD
ncbi:NACHT domain-containing protein [Nostocaceae cyanobacterium CENA369]|uniref:NACHT domain-containing protein n=1 Tax=Dendronalium phyllosphericum CENA369 TaxID=1725256 RepID=A0A8J7LEQ3_9NOST|nr:NACHT domain-containing protein [Dendronalium phyllosphericum]MBH8573019.1 NACHT domain-containing protein [Dendronalium phyllosphericum CENA369]